jgi:CRISPR type IV-associated protein Csf3
MSAAQNKKQDQHTGPGGAQPPAAQTPAPGADSITELKAKVEQLDAAVNDLKTSSHQSTPANPVQDLNRSLQIATWVTLIIMALILASAIWLWAASKRLNGLATTEAVNNAKEAVTNAVNTAREAVRSDITNAVSNARDAVTNAVNTSRDAVRNDITNAVNNARDMMRNDVATARDVIQNNVNNVSQNVGNARDAAHNDVNDLRQGLRETRSSLQDALEELKSKINTSPSH